MATIKVNNVRDLMNGVYSNLTVIKADILRKMSDHVEQSVVDDYTERVQQLYYPLRNPQTKGILESIPPQEIARFITKTVFENRAIVYLQPDTEADKSGRMQELYGGRPWHEIRMKMLNLEHVNQILLAIGLKGIRVKV